MNRTGSFRRLVLPLVIILLSVVSCRSPRQVIKEPLKEEGSEYLFSQLKKHETRFSHFSVRYTAVYTFQKKETSFTGQIRIGFDSIIWISLSPALGIEAMRILITQDSIKLLNRIEKTYSATDIRNMNRMINSTLDFDMLQAFLIGNDFSFYEEGTFRAGIDNKQYRLSTAQRAKLRKYLKENETSVVIPIQQIWLDPGSYKITKTVVRELESGGRKIEALYSHYQDVKEQRIPAKLFFQVGAEEPSELMLEYNRMIIDEEQQYPFSIPDRYTRVELFRQ